MATQVYTTEEVSLQDGTVVELKPLTIKNLRKFMKVINEELVEVKSEEEGMDVVLKAAALCLKNQKPEYWDEESQTYTEAFEDVADMPTVYKILEVCGGVKLNDPNLLAAAAAALGQN